METKDAVKDEIKIPNILTNKQRQVLRNQRIAREEAKRRGHYAVGNISDEIFNTYEKFSSHVFVSRETYEKLCMFEKILIKWQNSINLIKYHLILLLYNDLHVEDLSDLQKRILCYIFF